MPLPGLVGVPGVYHPPILSRASRCNNCICSSRNARSYFDVMRGDEVILFEPLFTGCCPGCFAYFESSEEILM